MMMKKIVLLILLSTLLLGFGQSNKIEALIQKEIKEVFTLKTYIKQSVAVSDELNEVLPLKISANNFFKIKNETNLVGYYYLGKAFGKTDYFDFIVILDEKLNIAKVKVLIYREELGGEVASNRWLNQFKGKSKNENLEYQKDIAAISGATISAKSITNEVNKLLKTVTILHNKKQL